MEKKQIIYLSLYQSPCPNVSFSLNIFYISDVEQGAMCAATLAHALIAPPVVYESTSGREERGRRLPNEV